MNTHTLLARAKALADDALLARLQTLAADDRRLTAEVVAHLAELHGRPNLYAAKGYGSLFAYCTRGLNLSEDAAATRITAARACLKYPAILDLLLAGAITLTTVRLLHKHLTPENHEAVLARATGRTYRELEKLAAELAPRPDARPMVRALPPAPAGAVEPSPPTQDRPSASAAPAGEDPEAAAFVLTAPEPRPSLQATAPQRVRLACTLDAEAEADLRALQDLLRRQVPDGDPGKIVKRALALLRRQEEGRRFGRTAQPRPAVIRRATDKRTRHVSAATRRETSARDGEVCAFVSSDGRRCGERAFLEFHHRKPYGKDGENGSGNIALFCRRHNQYEAERDFGRWPREGARPDP
ncbi:MAG TPA: hypothetical protein VFM29_08765 [Vicinamibacteria bacterium]|nr:hypothetical protein [Vicinamibacteria bacterium]